MYKNRQHPTEVECRLFCCPILLGRCRFCSFLKLLSYRHTAKLLSLLFISTPQSRLTPCQLPGRGAFWCALQPLVQSRRAANDGPYSASYKLSAKMKGRPPVPLLLYSLSTYSASSLLGSAFRLSSLGADSSSV